MSCWWDIDFSAIGAEPIVRELREKISDLEFEDGARLFHHVEVVKSAPGLVLVHASRNYRGEAAICELKRTVPRSHVSGLIMVGCRLRPVYSVRRTPGRDDTAEPGDSGF